MKPREKQKLTLILTALLLGIGLSACNKEISTEDGALTESWAEWTDGRDPSECGEKSLMNDDIRSFCFLSSANIPLCVS